MSHTYIKDLFLEAVHSVTSDISQYTIQPEKDFTRNKKFPADKLLSFLVSCGSSSTKIELLDFLGLDANAPSASAFNQQRAKLKPEALEAVFHHFNNSIHSREKSSGYRFLLLTVPVLHFLVNRSLHRKSIRSAKGILQKAFTVYT